MFIANGMTRRYMWCVWLCLYGGWLAYVRLHHANIHCRTSFIVRHRYIGRVMCAWGCSLKNCHPPTPQHNTNNHPSTTVTTPNTYNTTIYTNTQHIPHSTYSSAIGCLLMGCYTFILTKLISPSGRQG
jgi:hypothetical protein